MALAVKTRCTPLSEEQQYVEKDPTGMRIGIALSGGGIRSAAFNLGALQALQEKEVLERAEFLTAVSGGNYVASAMAISAAYSDPDLRNGKQHWAHGSAEERHLRLHSDYLAPGWTGRVWLSLSVVYGFVLNYLPFLLGAFLTGRVCGWLLHAGGVQLSDLQLTGLELPTSRLLDALLVLLVGCLFLALLLVAFRRFRDGRQRTGDYGATKSEPSAGALVAAAGALALSLALPALAAQYAVVSAWLLEHALREGPEAFETTSGRVEIAALWLLLTLAMASGALLLSRRLRARRLMLFLSSLAGAGLILVPLLSSLEYSARNGLQTTRDLAGAGGALVVMTVMAVTVHNRRYSLHLLYRERLNSAFALRRFRAPDGSVAAQPIPYPQSIALSSIGKRAAASTVSIPKLVVCCAVNLTTDEVPSGRFAESFTFEYDRSGCPMFGYHDTSRFETHPGPAGTQLTLPSIMAVSGAALSPIMGRFTYPPLRFLMAMTNVRLGIWVPNPKHPSWDEQLEPVPSGLWWRRIAAWAAAGWWEPGALHVLREALGTLDSTRRYIYLTDGGHWENLGLVELLRRRCTHVLCFDASSDRTGDGQDLGRAIALARSELGAQVELDPRPLIGDDTGPATDVAVRGTIRYPGREAEARIVYAKAALTEGASWDLQAFSRRDSLFPNHPTSQQMFTDEQFEAYRSLGHAAGLRAMELLNPVRALMLVGERGSEGLPQVDSNHQPAG